MEEAEELAVRRQHEAGGAVAERFPQIRKMKNGKDRARLIRRFMKEEVRPLEDKLPHDAYTFEEPQRLAIQATSMLIVSR